MAAIVEYVAPFFVIYGWLYILANRDEIGYKIHKIMGRPQTIITSHEPSLYKHKFEKNTETWNSVHKYLFIRWQKVKMVMRLPYWHEKNPNQFIRVQRIW